MKLFPLRYLSIVAIIVQLNFKDSESSGDIKLRQSCDLLRSRLFSLETVAQYLSRYILMIGTIMARARVVAMSMSRSMPPCQPRRRASQTRRIPSCSPKAEVASLNIAICIA